MKNGGSPTASLVLDVLRCFVMTHSLWKCWRTRWIIWLRASPSWRWESLQNSEIVKKRWDWSWIGCSCLAEWALLGWLDAWMRAGSFVGCLFAPLVGWCWELHEWLTIETDRSLQSIEGPKSDLSGEGGLNIFSPMTLGWLFPWTIIIFKWMVQPPTSYPQTLPGRGPLPLARKWYATPSFNHPLTIISVSLTIIKPHLAII